MSTQDHNTAVPNNPVDNLQLDQLKIEWVAWESIRPNKYNPNSMTYQDRMLLRTSLLEDGWTQPIVTLPDRTIVDGEQRWTTAGIEITPDDIQEIIDKMLKRGEQGAVVSPSILARLQRSKERLEAAVAAGHKSCIAAITGGLVPITRIDLTDEAHRQISTIRHNRARGSHAIDRMTAITQDLIKMGLDVDDLEKRLGMDDEEIRRFAKAAEGQMHDLRQQLANTDFNAAWSAQHITALPERAQTALKASAKANAALKEHHVQVAQAKQQVDQLVAAEVAQREAATGQAVTVLERDQIAAELAKTVPVPEKPKPPELTKLVMFVLKDEEQVIRAVLGEDLAVGLVKLCTEELARRVAEQVIADEGAATA